MKIYTLTLNPAYDVHANTDSLIIHHENFADVTSREAGGKGVNISRALCAVDVPNTAIIVVGKENDADFKNGLSNLGLNAVYLEQEGRIRENLTIHHGKEETRISFSGFSVDNELLLEVSRIISAEENAYVTFTGSIPNGISKSAAIDFLVSLKKKGIKLVVDCRSFDLADICQIGPWLVKPNQQEISQWFSAEINTLDLATEYADRLRDLGVENAMVSMGGQGAVLAAERVYTAIPPKIDPVSTIGAGDSSIAGFLVAAVNGQGNAECLRSAVAFGTAACLTCGTNPPCKEHISAIYRDILMYGGN